MVLSYPKRTKKECLTSTIIILGKIGDMLLDGEARQADLLKMRLEERKLRRKKLQEKLQEAEQELERKDAVEAELTEDIEHQYQESVGKA